MRGTLVAYAVQTSLTVAQERAVPDAGIDQAAEIMTAFAERTGVSSTLAGNRYLWTDAFAVCNFIGLARRGADSRLKLALRLVHRVHRTLGRHRDDDERRGWISGLAEKEGEAHPTRGGLRVGKPLPERGAREPFDPRLEWERDGQYFHYLAKWMHALDQLARVTGDLRYSRWARELAETAYSAFVYRRAGSPLARMYWKMSIDLSSPQVASMGQHDPLDGFVTYRELRTTAATCWADAGGPDLNVPSRQLEEMTDRAALVTIDPLGIGGLLIDAARALQLAAAAAEARAARSLEGWFDVLVSAAADGLEQYTMDELRGPAEARLAFRELGLAIGLRAVELVAGRKTGAPRERAPALRDYAALPEEIESFWLDPRHRSASSWRSHLDINEVMLATSLAPEGFSLLHRLPRIERDGI